MNKENQLQYQTFGQGEPLLLVHGWAMHAGVWADLAQRMAGCFQILAVDLRGHGASRGAPGPYTFAACAHDIIDLLRGLSLGPVFAVGWSMGVSILLKAIDAAPELIDRLVCISGNPCLVSRPDYPCGIPEITVRRLYRQVERSYPEGLKNFYSLLLTPQEQELFAKDMRYVAMTDTGRAPAKDAALATLSCLMQEDLRDGLARIIVPALILHGDADGICNPAGAAFMHSAIPGSKLVMFEQTGHAPLLTRCDDVAGLLRRFLENAP